MTTKTDAAAPAAQEDNPASAHAVLFMLEGLAGVGHKATFDVLTSILGEQGLKFTPVHMSRYCLHRHPELYLAELLEALDAGRQSAAGLMEDIKSGIEMQLSSKGQALPKGLSAILKELKNQGVELAAVTALPEGPAKALSSHLGLEELGARLVIMESDPSDEHDFPRADTWLKLAKNLKKNPLYCAVLAGDMATCKSALWAGMRCVVVPDSYAAFQDFGGADAVIDDIDEADTVEIVKLLCPID